MSDRPTSYSYDDLIKCAQGELFGEGNAQLPMPPMLMMDRITEISEASAISPAIRLCPVAWGSMVCGS